jgi:hypothetical protein
MFLMRASMPAEASPYFTIYLEQVLEKTCDQSPTVSKWPPEASFATVDFATLVTHRPVYPHAGKENSTTPAIRCQVGASKGSPHSCGDGPMYSRRRRVAHRVANEPEQTGVVQRFQRAWVRLKANNRHLPRACLCKPSTTRWARGRP